MDIKFILLLLRLIDAGIVFSITINKNAVLIRIKK